MLLRALCCALLAATPGALRVPRRAVLRSSVAAVAAPRVVGAKCADIETCRELGDAKVAAAEAANPTVRLADGVRYKQLKAGAGPALARGDVADVAFSISSAGGSYMYSRGLGFEKDAGGNVQRPVGPVWEIFYRENDEESLPTHSVGNVDAGDFLRVTLGKERRDVPAGIELALLGMQRGEKRRVELPPGDAVGFESSDWRPEPTSRRGKATIVGYKQILRGNGSSQPPFPALTVWDLELRRIR